ncbi:MAG: DNA-directed RNA polymerase subunit alpha [Acidimicrobiia bacterium]|nr:DNA-directed RNA polymerase subunit alpha [Acidimicrobiia bacterium]MYC58332.1 DNA-directed RNA polymerase subunit alpha [Acidimicrobiia bacterium]MYI29961.1 DNA-directed RNA polymerase subunit alpha [Acidimicrobiia bacterium]
MLVMQRPAVETVTDLDNHRQKFAVGPLEPGFGHTLGTSLRRALLSSIPGAAVIRVRFNDALHEFDTISGVAEDVTDILLNLKDLVLRCHSEEPVELHLDHKGPGEITGADLTANPDIEVLNPELLIARLNDKARLTMDITISQGRGYVSAETNKLDSTIGVIPIDSIFSPVRRVTYVVEPTRVEQSTEFDRLVLDIETDGSISPQEALASAGGTLRALVQLVEEMSEEPQGLAIAEAGSAPTGAPDLDLPIEDLELSERPRNCLKRAQINMIGELLSRTQDELLAITNFGQKSLDEVNEKLDERGLALAAGPRG